MSEDQGMDSEVARYMDFARRKLASAQRTYEAGLFDCVGTSAYLAALAAARAVARASGMNPPKSHVAVRTALRAMIRRGLNFDQEVARFLVDGRKIMWAADKGAHFDATHAVTSLNRGRAFVSAAEKVRA